MYTYMYIHTCINACRDTCIWLHMYGKRIYIYIYIYICVNEKKKMYVQICIYIYIYVYISKEYADMYTDV